VGEEGPGFLVGSLWTTNTTDYWLKQSQTKKDLEDQKRKMTNLRLRAHYVSTKKHDLIELLKVLLLCLRIDGCYLNKFSFYYLNLTYERRCLNDILNWISWFFFSHPDLKLSKLFNLLFPTPVSFFLSHPSL